MSPLYSSSLGALNLNLIEYITNENIVARIAK